MAYATQITISTGNKVSLNYQSQEVNVTLTYQLERDDIDMMAIVKEKTVELAQAHRAAWQTLHDAKVAAPHAMSAKTSTCHESESNRESRVLCDEQKASDSQKRFSEPQEDDRLLPPDGLAQADPKIPLEPATPGQCRALRLLLDQASWNDERILAHLRAEFSCEDLKDLSAPQATQWLMELQRAARNNAQQQRLNGSHNGTTHSSAKN